MKKSWPKPIQASIGWETGHNYDMIVDKVQYFDTMDQAEEWVSNLLKNDGGEKHYDIGNAEHEDSQEFQEDDTEIEAQIDELLLSEDSMPSYIKNWY
jgi:hypothetical protein